MGREHDFFVGDFVLVGIVFLLLVVFREQFLAALVGSGRNGGFIVAPLNDGDFTVRAWQACALLSPGIRAKKEQGTISDFLLCEDLKYNLLLKEANIPCENVNGSNYGLHPYILSQFQF